MGDSFAYLASFGKDYFASPAMGGALPIWQPVKMAENRIKELRAAKGMTLEELAEKVEFDPSYVQRLENGSRNLAVKHFAKFAKALGVEPRDLVVANNPAMRSQNPSDKDESHNHNFQRRGDETFPQVGNIRDAPPFGIRRAALPIRGRSMAGKEGAFQFGGDDIVGWADATEKLANIPGAYAVYVIGRSMEPVLKSGYICHVDPHSPASNGLVVIQVSTDDGATIIGYVKELVSIDDKLVKAREYWPEEKILKWPRKHVREIHRVVLWGPPY